MSTFVHRIPRSLVSAVLLVLLAVACATEKAGDDAAISETEALLAESVQRTLAFYPTRALGAGHYASDGELESFSAAEVADWVQWNRTLLERAQPLLGRLEAFGEEDGASAAFDARADLALAMRDARLQIFRFDHLRVAERDPLLWSGRAANAIAFLLIREDRPLADRLRGLQGRIEQLPRLANEAEASLARASDEDLSPDLLAIAVRQLRNTAAFYRTDWPAFLELREVAEQDAAPLRSAAEVAATSLDALADYFEERRTTAVGSFRLASDYAENYRLTTGDDRPIAEVLSAAEQALRERRGEAAIFARRVWGEWMEGEIPFGDHATLRAFFSRLGEDRAADIEEFIEDYRTLVDEAEQFVRERELVTLPDPLTLIVDRTPEYFTSQAFGGVYSTGPWAPEADTLLLLPTPSARANAEQVEQFFRDFNHHFNTMIIAHELVPGHYQQLKTAARQQRPARFLYADGVFVEGWGTFSERLMLQAGWGDDLAYGAHLKKQLENIARTIVDIRVHTLNMTRDEVLEFVQREAIQDRQFAENMWVRAMTSSPQLTTYWLGDETIRDLHAAFLETREPAAAPSFADEMMQVGPVSLSDVRSALGLDQSAEPESES